MDTNKDDRAFLIKEIEKNKDVSKARWEDPEHKCTLYIEFK